METGVAVWWLVFRVRVVLSLNFEPDIGHYHIFLTFLSLVDIEWYRKLGHNHFHIIPNSLFTIVIQLKDV
jgi:hypothetical protein